jgi:hypothetical protein
MALARSSRGSWRGDGRWRFVVGGRAVMLGGGMRNGRVNGVRKGLECVTWKSLWKGYYVMKSVLVKADVEDGLGD